MLVITFFTLVFFIAIYLTGDRYKSVLMVVAANALKLLAVILMYLEGYIFWINAEPFVNFLSMAQVTFWIAAVFTILRIRIHLVPLIGINVINLVQGIYFTAINAGNEIIHSLNSVSIALIALYCIITVSKKRLSVKRTETVILTASLILFVGFHILRSILCLQGTLVHGSFPESGIPFKFMSTLGYAFFHLMNFVIIYLNHNYLIRKVRQLSYTDKLTGALNRSFFLKILEVKLADLKRMDNKLVLAIMDIDNFKAVNDTYGHLAGDEVLKGFTEYLKENIRQNDIICRYGGEEFLILMEVAGKKEAELALRRLQEIVREKEISEYKIKVTFSCGMEFLGEEDCDRGINDLIKLIDFRLYQAKNAGKDCII